MESYENPDGSLDGLCIQCGARYPIDDLTNDKGLCDSCTDTNYEEGID